MRERLNWDEIQSAYDAGCDGAQLRERFKIKPQAWYKAIARGRFVLREDDRRLLKSRGPGNFQYDWPAVEAYYNAGHSYRECRARFGFSAAAWTDAVRRGALRARARLLPIHEVIAHAKSRSHLKRRLLAAGIVANCCEACGISQWRGRPLAIQIDHINGNSKDHRLENLRMLCPNCHAQTETFAGKNRKIFPSSLVGRAPDSESGGPSFESTLGSTIGPIV